MYRIEKEANPDGLYVHLSGFMTTDEIDLYARERRLLVEQAGWTDGQFVMLVDISDFNIQSREIAEQIQKLATSPQTRPRRMAVVTGAHAAGMQARRIFKDATHILVTTSLGEARTYLADT